MTLPHERPLHEISEDLPCRYRVKLYSPLHGSHAYPWLQTPRACKYDSCLLLVYFEFVALFGITKDFDVGHWPGTEISR